MADFISNPQVIEPDQIILYGKRYRTKGPVRVTMGTQFPGKVVIGDFGKNDNPRISTYTVSDLRGGMGLWRYTDPDGQLDRFWTSVGMNTLWAGAITLGPYPDKVIDCSQYHPISMQVFQDYLVWQEADKELFYNNLSGGATTLVDTLPGDAYASLVFNSRCFWFQGSNGYSYQTSPTSAATDVATPTAQGGVIWDGKIWVLDTDFQLHYSATGDAASWIAVGNPIPTERTSGDVRYGELAIYESAAGDLVIWALTDSGPYLWDDDTSKWYRARLKFPKHRIVNTPRTFGGSYRENLVVRTDDLSVHKLTMGNGSLLVQNISPYLPDGLPTMYNDVIGGFQSTPSNLYTAFSRLRGTSASYDAMLAYNNRGWHPLNTHYSTSGSQTTGPRPLAIGDTANGYYLCVPTLSRSHTNAIFAYNLKDLDITNPRFNSSYYHVAGGYLDLPYFDAGYEAQQKLALKLRVKFTPGVTSLGANYGSLVISYALNGSDSWTALSAITASSSEQTIVLGTNNVGVAFKSIRFRRDIGDITGSPVEDLPPIVEYLSMDYMRLPEVRKAFVVQLDCNNPVDDRTPAQCVDDLWSAIDTSTLGTFAYRDDAGNTRSYLVKILQPEGVESPGEIEGGLYSAYLYEVVGNDGT